MKNSQCLKSMTAFRDLVKTQAFSFPTLAHKDESCVSERVRARVCDCLKVTKTQSTISAIPLEVSSAGVFKMKTTFFLFFSS